MSEYEPQFWGFDTQEEWDAFQHEIAKKGEEEFHRELLKHLRGEPNDIKLGTIGMLMAQIAEKLVADDPELLMPINKDKLHELIHWIYNRDHAITVKLSDEEIAAAQPMVTHEGDLPSA